MALRATERLLTAFSRRADTFSAFAAFARRAAHVSVSTTYSRQASAWAPSLSSRWVRRSKREFKVCLLVISPDRVPGLVNEQKRVSDRVGKYRILLRL